MPAYTSYNKHTCSKVSPGLDVQSRTHLPASVFGFYPIHRAIHIFVALRDIFVDVLSTFSRPKNHWALNTSLSTSRLPLLHFFFGFSSVSVCQSPKKFFNKVQVQRLNLVRHCYCNVSSFAGEFGQKAGELDDKLTCSKVQFVNYLTLPLSSLNSLPENFRQKYCELSVKRYFGKYKVNLERVFH